MNAICFSFQGKRIVFMETHTSPDVYHPKCSMFDCVMLNPDDGDKSEMTKRKSNIFVRKGCFIVLQIVFLNK